jgi:tetratricopeptide (TPR) repeat protein
VPDPAIAVEQIPDISEVVCNRGFAFFKKAQWDAAVLDLEKEITLDPSLDRDKWNVDWARSKKQEWDLAIADYNKIAELLGADAKYVEISDDNLEALYDLAVEDYQYITEIPTDDALVLKAEEALDYMANWRQDVGWQFVK